MMIKMLMKVRNQARKILINSFNKQLTKNKKIKFRVTKNKKIKFRVTKNKEKIKKIH
jgi:hypothetical protein